MDIFVVFIDASVLSVRKDGVGLMTEEVPGLGNPTRT